MPLKHTGVVEIQLYSFCNLGVWSGWVVNDTPLLLYPWGMARYPLARRMGGPHSYSGQVWKIPENLTPTRIQSPDFPAHCRL